MQFSMRPEGLLERLALWFNLGPIPIAQAFWGMMGSRAAMAGVKLGVYALLATESLPAAELATRLKLDPVGALRLLESLEALALVSSRAGTYALHPRARPWLDPASKTYVGGFLSFNYAQWDWWGQLEEIVRSGRSAEIHQFPPEDPRWAEYIEAMFELARLAAPEVASAIALPASATSVLDLAGAHGWFAAELCRRHPKLAATVIDLPGSSRVGREIIAREGMAERVRHVDGDLAVDPLGGPHDVILCFQIVHHLSAEQNVALLKKVRAALKPGGSVAVLEYLVPEHGRKPDSAALLGLHYYLTSTAATYSLADVRGWLKEAGFATPSARPIRRMPLQTLVQARAQ